jgi:hypothetical protein
LQNELGLEMDSRTCKLRIYDQNFLRMRPYRAAATPGAAQIGNPAGVAPGTQEAAPGEPAPHQTNTEDRLFVRLLAAGGMAEVDFGRLTEGKARSQPVKDFAQLMVADHTKANRELERLIRRCIRPRLHARAGRPIIKRQLS